MTTRKNVSFSQQIAIDRWRNVYVMGGCWNPVDRTVGTDCSDTVGKQLAAATAGTAMNWARAVSTESWRPPSMGGGADPNNGPYGTVMVDHPDQFPPDAAVLLALHHGDGSAADSHMWCQVDQLKIETHGSSSQFPNGATVLNDGVHFTDDVRDVRDTSYANNWWYLPGPIVEDGTAIPTAPSPQGGDAPMSTALFGPDLSNNNWSSTGEVAGWLDACFHREGFSWMEHKVSEGNYYSDPYWPVVRDWCAANNVPCIGYHYVTTNDPTSQAATFKNNGGGNVAMLDFEANSGALGNFWAVVNAFNAAGITVTLSYIPRWYWQQIGSPDLSTVPGLISSAYFEEGTYASTEYADAGGDQGSGWAPYGGATPVIWQFSDGAIIDGKSVDANAFKGTIDQLQTLLAGSPTDNTPPPSTGSGPFMALTDQQQADMYNAIMGTAAAVASALALVTDNNTQLRGPNQEGWPQLGQNAEGENLTLVDAIAAFGDALDALASKAAH